MNLDERAVALLHELGHIYAHVFGDQSTTIRNDEIAVDPTGAISANNQRIVREACVK